MVNPGELLDSVVSAIRLCEALIADELNEEPGAIYSFKDGATAGGNRLAQAVESASVPSIVVAHGGISIGERRNNERHRHQVRLFLTPREDVEYGPFIMLDKLMNAVMPTGLSFEYFQIHPECFPPEQIHLQREMRDGKSDLWFIAFFLTEING